MMSGSTVIVLQDSEKALLLFKDAKGQTSFIVPTSSTVAMALMVWIEDEIATGKMRPNRVV